MRHLTSLTEKRSARYTWDAPQTPGNIPAVENNPEKPLPEAPQTPQSAEYNQFRHSVQRYAATRCNLMPPLN
jgi:hypothetical protein